MGDPSTLAMAAPATAPERTRRLRWQVAAAAGCAFVLTALFRYLALTGFPNDQYEHLAGAQQMLFGEWPSKDFLDPGMPLMYAASAGAQLLLGRTLFAEAALDFFMLGLAAACTLIGAFRVSRSLPIAVTAAVLSVLIFPRPYTYPRLLMAAIAPLAIWAWIARPAMTRMAGLAATVVAAFLFRYDLGAYAGLGALVALLAAPAEKWTRVLQRVALFGGVLALLLTPYALLLGGYRAFADSLLRFLLYGSRHAGRNALDVTHLGTVYETGLFWGFHAAPFIALALLIVDRVRRRQPSDAPMILPLAALAMASNYFLIGDTLVSRLPDAVVPDVLLFAWLAARLLQPPARQAHWARVGTAAIVTLLAAYAIIMLESIPEQLRRTGLASRGVLGIPDLLEMRTAQLTTRFSPQQVPDASLIPLVPFMEYLDRCTAGDHRLFVAGYAPQIYVYAHRAFGGGEKVFLQGSFDSPADQQFIVDRLTRQTVVFALAYSDEFEMWQESFPVVAAFLASHFTPMAVVVAPNRRISILLNPAIRSLRTDTSTGWPCYR